MDTLISLSILHNVMYMICCFHRNMPLRAGYNLRLSAGPVSCFRALRCYYSQIILRLEELV